MKGLIMDYGATIDSGGKHWSEVMWEGYCKMSLPITKEQFREAYVYSERYVAMSPEIIAAHYNFYQLMQVRIGIQVEFLLQTEALTEELLSTTLSMIYEGETPIIDDNAGLTSHFVDVIAGYCYDYARRCTLSAIPLIEHLSKSYTLALVSNFYGNLRAVLEDFELTRFFPYIIDSALVGVRKPDSNIFRLAMNEMGLEPSDIVVVGDSYSKDICPAVALGCKAIWVKGLGWDASDNVIHYEPSVSSLVELYDLL